MMFFLSDEMPFSFDELLLFGAASGGKLVEDTATGNPLTFTTDVAKALKSLSIPFLPVQSGTGDPSPSNIRPIVPWEGLTVFHSGADTSNPTETDVVFSSPVYGGTLDIVSGVLTVGWESKTFDGSENWTAYNNGDTANLCYYVSIGRKKNGKGNLLCDKLSEYTGSGNLWDVPAYLKISGHPASNNVYCTAEEPLEGGVTSWREWLSNNPLQIAYELAAPIEIQLTPAQITALVGNNTIWSDADGTMTAVFFKKA